MQGNQKATSCRYTIHIKETSNEIHERGLRSRFTILQQQGSMTARHKVKTATSHIPRERTPPSEASTIIKGTRTRRARWRFMMLVEEVVDLQFAADALLSFLFSFYEAKEWGKTPEIKVLLSYIASYPALTENSLLFGIRDVDNTIRICVDSRLFI